VTPDASRPGSIEEPVAPLENAGVSRNGDLGGRLRQLRSSRGLSLAEVADATGISPSFLSIVENGQSDITVSRLMRLVHWYGVSIADLLQAPDRSVVRVVRAEQRRSIELSDEHIKILMLAPDGQHAMMPVINVYGEGGGMAESAQHDGEEFVYVLSGTIELDIGNEDPIVLGSGDSAYYRAEAPHSFRNVGDGEACFLGVTTPPNL
jgi:transcriptional regulator with XRE-family HTH domain